MHRCATSLLTTLAIAWAAAAASTTAVASRASAGGASPAWAAPIPAFDARQLAANPREGWWTNGGSLSNERYSPLDLINRGNVSELKARWRASLNGSGLTPRAGNQAQPIVYGDGIYIMTGDGDAFAVDLQTGKVRWEFRANVDPKVARPCCGWPGRGVAIGDGMVFVGELDARLIALDQRTGRVRWSVQAEDPRAGYSIASAPLYYDGMVITGFAGSDLGTRGRVKAYDARTGRLRWTFYTVPGPGELGHDTWPPGSDVWKHGGAAVWQTPAIDPQLGLLYFSTANPGPVLDGAIRAGDNLFSVSIVAVDVHTGKYRWHFQQVHHDLWDYDSANPVILFDAMYDGKLRKGIAEGAKTGWVYILDRVTGKPLVGIDEHPVMQLAQQHTSPTQPFPIGDAIVPQSIDIAPEGYDLVNDGRIFTPFAKHPAVWKPLAAINWPPSSYDPRIHTMFICATDSLWGAVGGDPNYPVEPGALYSGSVVQRFAAPRRGIFAALDVTTNRLVWRQQWVDTCYSGSVVTAGGLVFVGRNDGRLTALDELNGHKLWQFQTDGGVNAPASVFENDGNEYVLVLAGGTALAGSKRNDGLWLFSLDGTLPSLPPGSADPTRPRRAPAGTTTQAAGTTASSPANLDHGREIFVTACVVCHGESGQGGGGHGGPALTHVLTRDSIVTVVTHGRNQMPAFGSALEAQDLNDLVGYVLKIAAQR
ncbi:MAG TPA: PQQ-binding-like beta-propeller repeat protein [Steroidobacteraceae bacterium]|nr:PQQ-binding-like beta-propeller repeat protein [Steroidobacteraceae bacterium]